MFKDSDSQATETLVAMMKPQVEEMMASLSKTLGTILSAEASKILQGAEQEE